MVVSFDLSGGLGDLVGEDSGWWSGVDAVKVTVDTLGSVTWWELLGGEDTGWWGGVGAVIVTVDSL